MCCRDGLFVVAVGCRYELCVLEQRLWNYWAGWLGAVHGDGSPVHWSFNIVLVYQLLVNVGAVWFKGSHLDFIFLKVALLDGFCWGFGYGGCGYVAMQQEGRKYRGGEGPDMGSGDR
ncbi:hypothetical protein F0562_005804 [Nyssa sinensis]|uniref:Uncharacterized protein n=1 Tax=Nyssa sinensis TaxID=561372 RepID=A0A5J5AJ74_9ASTE|nr:hypothetical protein F0562_005804 [Nyssa sinensis]